MKTILCYLGGIGFQELIVFILALLICIGIFLLIRSIILWYWKIDAIVENQKKQLEELQRTSALIEQLIRNNRS